LLNRNQILGISLLFLLIVVSLQGSQIHTTKFSITTGFLSSNQSSSPPISELTIPQNNSEPIGITVDNNGNVWFAESATNESGGQIVEYIPSTGVFNNFSIPAPPQIAGFIWFIVFDKSGTMWFSDASQPYLWRFSPQTKTFADFYTGAPQIDPYSLRYESNNNQIWFTSIYTGQIGVFQIGSNENASLLKLIAVPSPDGKYQTPNGLPIIGPSGLAFDANDSLFVSESFASAIAEYDLSTANFTRVIRLPLGSSPVGLGVLNGDLWFTNHATSNIGLVALNNESVTEYSTSLFSNGNDTITLPYWIQISSDGMVWFDEHIGNKIARFDPSNLELTEFAIPTSASSPLNLALDNTRGEVWFTEFTGNKIGVLSQNASFQSPVSLSSNKIDLAANPISLTVNFAALGSSSPNVFSPLVSGTMTIDGSLDSNLTITDQAVNSTAFKMTFTKGSEISSGSYTLTICPRLSSSESEFSAPPIRQCSIAYLTVENSQSSFNEIEIYVLAGIIIAILVTISIYYVKRWGSD
jgi:streptogramin lyase